MDTCILAEVITHSFRTSSPESKASSSIGSHFSDVFSSSFGAPLPGLPTPHLSTLLDSFRVPLPSYSLPIVSFNTFLLSSVLLFGPGCCFLPSIFFGVPPSTDSPSLSAIFGSSSLPGSPDLLSTIANHLGKILKNFH